METLDYVLNFARNEASRSSKFKIGLTCAPILEFMEAAKPYYDEVMPIQAVADAAHADQVLHSLYEYFSHEPAFMEKLENECRPLNFMYGKTENYYIYIRIKY